MTAVQYLGAHRSNAKHALDLAGSFNRAFLPDTYLATMNVSNLNSGCFLITSYWHRHPCSQRCRLANHLRANL